MICNIFEMRKKRTWPWIVKWTGIGIGTIILVAFAFFFIGSAAPADHVDWGAAFSKAYAEKLGLDARAAYLAILDDLKIKRIRLGADWDAVEPQNEHFDFRDLDFELREAKARNAKILLVLGQKTPRWPECHIPSWAKPLGAGERQARILEYLDAVVARYKSHPEIRAWQVENEPFFPFGECPPRDDAFLKQEIATVKKLDPSRPVVVTESGEFSLWFAAARVGDIVGTTLYRGAYFDPIHVYVSYPFPPVFYARKAWLVQKLFGKDSINVELQAEPWAHTFITGLTNEEMDQTMSIAQFKSNIQFAKDTGFREIYFWGAEWWYFMKEKQGNPAFWNEAKKLFPRGG